MSARRLSLVGYHSWLTPLTAATLARGAVRAGCLGSKSRRAKHLARYRELVTSPPVPGLTLVYTRLLPIFNLDSNLDMLQVDRATYRQTYALNTWCLDSEISNC